MSGFASAPASSANLGPGFDVLALALSIRCSVTASPADSWAISQDGETTEPDTDNLVRRAASLLAEGPFHFTIENAIPRGRGLGSSAAVAVAAGAAALRARSMKPSARRLFEVAAAVDGHADNAAAAVYGGFVAVSDGVVTNLEVHPGLRVVVGIPEAPLATSEARAALPAQMSREAAARNLGRIVFLIEGMRSADAAVLGAAAGDEIHEAPRRSLSPVTSEMIEAARRAGAYHAAWSGAGPSTMALAPEHLAAGVQEAVAGVLGGAGTSVCLDIDYDGWR